MDAEFYLTNLTETIREVSIIWTGGGVGVYLHLHTAIHNASERANHLALTRVTI